MTHFVEVTDTSLRLVHPEACAEHQECREGSFERSVGLEAAARRWGNGRHPVEWFGGFFEPGCEWDEWLQLAEDDEVEVAPAPVAGGSAVVGGRVRRWSA